MTTKEQVLGAGAFGADCSFGNERRTAAYAVREAAYLVEDAVLDFFVGMKRGLLEIPEIAMVRRGSASGIPLADHSLRDKIVAGALVGLAAAALLAIAVLA